MKIAIIGYGKMGKMVEKKAIERGYQISAIVPAKGRSLGHAAEADVWIDFTHPLSAVDNLKAAAALKKNVVMGTSGWTDRFSEVKTIVEEAKIGFLYAPNFSLGMALFLQLVEKASSLFSSQNGYDAAGIEVHHQQKVDAPSGTAKAIADRYHAAAPSGTKPLEFTSVRVGTVPGTHSLIFDSPDDTITITHTARSREAWANGALTAASWLKGRTGIFSLNDVIGNSNG